MIFRAAIYKQTHDAAYNIADYIVRNVAGRILGAGRITLRTRTSYRTILLWYFLHS